MFCSDVEKPSGRMIPDDSDSMVVVFFTFRDSPGSKDSDMEGRRSAKFFSVVCSATRIAAPISRQDLEVRRVLGALMRRPVGNFVRSDSADNTEASVDFSWSSTWMAFF